MSEIGTFTLGVVLRETGINADTLRAWERRYGLPQPTRSEGGQRLYSQRDIEIIRWLMQRQKEGMRIGQAVKLWQAKNAEGESLLKQSFSFIPEKDSLDKAHLTPFSENWISACLSYNETAAEQIANEVFVRFPPERAFLEIFIPAIRKMGELWYQGDATVQQEHFASALLMRRLNTLISALPAPTRPEKVIVGCPPKEEHTLPMLLITLYLRRRGFQVVYLGANLPLDQFTETAREIQPQLVILGAQQLTTAATLEESAQVLSQENIPVAFSGRIFTSTPELRTKISGHFLGETLPEVFQNSEKLLLQNPSPIFAEKDENPYKALQEQFEIYHPTVHHHLMTALIPFGNAQIPFATLKNTFSEANGFMSANILACLQLGNLDFLRAEFAWARVLIQNHGQTQVPITSYWQLYAESLHTAMGDVAMPLVDWLMAEAAK